MAVLLPPKMFPPLCCKQVGAQAKYGLRLFSLGLAGAGRFKRI